MPDERRDRLTSVAVLASVHPLQLEAHVAELERHRPGPVLLRHEIGAARSDGIVHRVVRHEGREVEREIEVDLECCLSCQVRADIVAAVTELRGPAPIVVVVPPTIEVGSVAAELDLVPGVHLDVVAAVVDADRVERDLTDLEGIPGAEEEGVYSTVGWELTHLLRTCDLVLRSPADQRAVALIAALSGVAPQTTSQDPGWVGRGVHRRERLRRQRRPGSPVAPTQFDRAGVQTRTWSARRPFHPDRLSELIGEHAFTEAIHVHGHCWVATRQATILSIDALADRTILGVVGVWQDALDPRQAAVLDDGDWDHYYGDRNQHLQITTVDEWGEWLEEALEDALLTDAELAEGREGWAAWDDPFRRWLDDERELVARHRPRGS